MKYASRHALYPVPNVFDVVAARDTLVGFVAVRPVDVRWVLTATRDAPDAFLVLVVERDVVVRPAFVVVRCVTARDDVVVLRGETAFVFCRCDTVICGVLPEFRLFTFVVRNAASDAPMHIKHTVRKDRIPFIPYYNYDSSKK